jgi:hypothetical protein
MPSGAPRLEGDIDTYVGGGACSVLWERRWCRTLSGEIGEGHAGKDSFDLYLEGDLAGGGISMEKEVPKQPSRRDCRSS